MRDLRIGPLGEPIFSEPRKRTRFEKRPFDENMNIFISSSHFPTRFRALEQIISSGEQKRKEFPAIFEKISGESKFFNELKRFYTPSRYIFRARNILTLSQRLEIWRHSLKFVFELDEISKMTADLFSPDEIAKMDEIWEPVVKKIVQSALGNQTNSEWQPALEAFLTRFSDGSPQKLKEDYENLGILTNNFSPILFDENISDLTRGSELEEILAKKLENRGVLFDAENLEAKPYWEVFVDVFEKGFFLFAQTIANIAVSDNFPLGETYHKHLTAQAPTHAGELEGPGVGNKSQNPLGPGDSRDLEYIFRI